MVLGVCPVKGSGQLTVEAKSEAECGLFSMLHFIALLVPCSWRRTSDKVASPRSRVADRLSTAPRIWLSVFLCARLHSLGLDLEPSRPILRPTSSLLVLLSPSPTCCCHIALQPEPDPRSRFLRRRPSLSPFPLLNLARHHRNKSVSLSKAICLTSSKSLLIPSDLSPVSLLPSSRRNP